MSCQGFSADESGDGEVIMQGVRWPDKSLEGVWRHGEKDEQDIVMFLQREGVQVIMDDNPPAVLKKLKYTLPTVRIRYGFLSTIL
jgi:hypothetical protein